MVEEGVDLALRVGRIADSSLIVRRLRNMQMVVCASPAYWAKSGLLTHPDDLWLYAAYSQRRHNSAALKALLAFLEERWKQD